MFTTRDETVTPGIPSTPSNSAKTHSNSEGVGQTMYTDQVHT